MASLAYIVIITAGDIARGVLLLVIVAFALLMMRENKR